MICLFFVDTSLVCSMLEVFRQVASSSFVHRPPHNIEERHVLLFATFIKEVCLGDVMCSGSTAIKQIDPPRGIGPGYRACRPMLKSDSSTEGDSNTQGFVKNYFAELGNLGGFFWDLTKPAR